MSDQAMLESSKAYSSSIWLDAYLAVPVGGVDGDLADDGGCLDVAGALAP